MTNSFYKNYIERIEILKFICIQTIFIYHKNEICGPLAQLVEQFPFKEWVDGSSPSRLTTLFLIV